MSEKKCGFVGIIGRPNVGKSTLLNTILEKKISITSKKPQTTRDRILGIKNTPEAQMIFADTPGIHLVEPRALNKYMNKIAKRTMRDVDVVLVLVEACKITAEDSKILSMLATSKLPKILAITKVDLLANKENLLPFIDKFQEYAFNEIIPISSKANANIDKLLATITHYLPGGVELFGPEAYTDKSVNFIVAEFIREQLVRNLNCELPYATSVEIVIFDNKEKLIEIHANIWVERAGQKAIVIGQKGTMLKLLGTKARLVLEEHFAKKVLLKLWVKEKSNWADDSRAMQSLGYRDDEK